MAESVPKELNVTPSLNRRDFLKVSAVVLFSAELTSAFEKSQSLDLSPDGPLHDINLTIDYVVHSQNKDLPGNFDNALRDCDVFVPEWSSWTTSDLTFFNDVSNGLKTDKDIDRFGTDSDYFRTVLKHLRGTKKRVADLDVPQGSALDIERAEMQPLFLPDYTQSYDNRVISLKMLYDTYASWNRDREDLILNNLYLLVRQMRAENPVKFDGSINIFMEYGNAHTRLYHLLIKGSSAVSLSEHFPAERFSFLPSVEVLRRFWFAEDSKDPKKVALPDNRLMAGVVMEDLIMNWFYEPNLAKFKTTADAHTYIRGIVDLFNRNGAQDSRELWDYQLFNRGAWNQGGKTLASSELPPSLRQVLAQKMRAYGVDEDFINAGLAESNKPLHYAYDFLRPRGRSSGLAYV